MTVATPIVVVQPAPGETELVPTLVGDTARQADGAILLRPGERVRTADAYKAPVTFHVLAMTDSTNLRLAYAGATRIIFNWEQAPDKLLVDGGPADGVRRTGAGLVPIDRWVDLGLHMTAKRLTITVDGQVRAELDGDFSAVDEPLAVFPAESSRVRVRSIRVRPE